MAPRSPQRQLRKSAIGSASTGAMATLHPMSTIRRPTATIRLRRPDVLQLFAADPGTDAIVLIGEIGGAAEETAAVWAAETSGTSRRSPSSPAGPPRGQADGPCGGDHLRRRRTAASKVEALEAAGFRVAGSPTELPGLLPTPATGRRAAMDLADIRFLTASIGGPRRRSSTRPPGWTRATWSAPNMVGERGLGGDPGPSARRPAALAASPDRRRGRGAKARGRSPARSRQAPRGLGGEWAGYDAWFERWSPTGSTRRRAASACGRRWRTWSTTGPSTALRPPSC